MNHQLNGIDHVIIGVRDLEAARAQYARLGFNSTPRGRHVGWGTANYCIMFEHDYLELLGIVDPSQFTNGLDRFLERARGHAGLVVGSRDADGNPQPPGSRPGLSRSEVKALGRLLESEAGAVELRFRNVVLPRSSTGGAEPVRLPASDPGSRCGGRPGWRIPNGARAIRSCTIVASDPAPLREAMARLFGAAAITRTDKVVAAHTGHGVIVDRPAGGRRADAPVARRARSTCRSRDWWR